MSCYFNHIKELFAEEGVEITNKSKEDDKVSSLFIERLRGLKAVVANLGWDKSNRLISKKKTVYYCVF